MFPPSVGDLCRKVSVKLSSRNRSVQRATSRRQPVEKNTISRPLPNAPEIDTEEAQSPDDSFPAANIYEKRFINKIGRSDKWSTAVGATLDMVGWEEAALAAPKTRKRLSRGRIVRFNRDSGLFEVEGLDDERAASDEETLPPCSLYDPGRSTAQKLSDDGLAHPQTTDSAGEPSPFSFSNRAAQQQISGKCSRLPISVRIPENTPAADDCPPLSATNHAPLELPVECFSSAAEPLTSTHDFVSPLGGYDAAEVPVESERPLDDSIPSIGTFCNPAELSASGEIDSLPLGVWHVGKARPFAKGFDSAVTVPGGTELPVIEASVSPEAECTTAESPASDVTVLPQTTYSPTGLPASWYVTLPPTTTNIPVKSPADAADDDTLFLNDAYSPVKPPTGPPVSSSTQAPATKQKSPFLSARVYNPAQLSAQHSRTPSVNDMMGQVYMMEEAIHPSTTIEVLQGLGAMFEHIPFLVVGSPGLVHYGQADRSLPHITIACPTSSRLALFSWARTKGMYRFQGTWGDSFGYKTTGGLLCRVRVRGVLHESFERLRAASPLWPGDKAKVMTLPCLVNEYAALFARGAGPRAEDSWGPRERAAVARQIIWLLFRIVERKQAAEEEGERSEHEFVESEVSWVLTKEFWRPFIKEYPDAVELFRAAGVFSCLDNGYLPAADHEVPRPPPKKTRDFALLDADVDVDVNFSVEQAPRAPTTLQALDELHTMRRPAGHMPRVKDNTARRRVSFREPVKPVRSISPLLVRAPSTVSRSESGASTSAFVGRGRRDGSK